MCYCHQVWQFFCVTYFNFLKARKKYILLLSDNSGKQEKCDFFLIFSPFSTEQNEPTFRYWLLLEQQVAFTYYWIVITTTEIWKVVRKWRPRHFTKLLYNLQNHQWRVLQEIVIKVLIIQNFLLHHSLSCNRQDTNTNTQVLESALYSTWNNNMQI